MNFEADYFSCSILGEKRPELWEFKEQYSKTPL